MKTVMMKVMMIVILVVGVEVGAMDSAGALQPASTTRSARTLREEFEPSWIRKIFEPKRCNADCQRDVITKAKEAVMPSVAQDRPSFSFTMIVQESRESFSNDGIMKFIFTVIANTFFQTLNIVLPNIRVMIEDRWMELRMKGSTILDKYVPGGALAVRR